MIVKSSEVFAIPFYQRVTSLNGGKSNNRDVPCPKKGWRIGPRLHIQRQQTSFYCQTVHRLVFLMRFVGLSYNCLKLSEIKIKECFKTHAVFFTTINRPVFSI